MNKPQLKKGQHNEPGIDFSKVKLCEFIPEHKPRIISQPLRVEQVPKNYLNTKELDKMNRLKKTVENGGIVND
ncbi:hypothetical protein PS423_09720 [Pediococcus acidilactici]|uniref:hypothetical protein n=1 Tax=Pediococcus acidilactici TaxID=1254 RepID=UPI002F268CD2